MKHYSKERKDAIAFLTVFTLIVRVHKVVEHAAVPDLFDPDMPLRQRASNYKTPFISPMALFEASVSTYN
ncbi:MAG: hypothetical protein V7746_12775 [Halioglobus sp.]